MGTPRSADRRSADRYAWITALNLSRKRHRWSRTKRFLRGDESLAALPATGTLEADAARAQEQAALHAAIARLPEKLRSVLLLVEFSELSYESISQLLSIPPGTVGLTAESRSQAASVESRR